MASLSLYTRTHKRTPKQIYNQKKKETLNTRQQATAQSEKENTLKEAIKFEW